MSTLAATPRPRAVVLAVITALAALLILGTALAGLGVCWSAGHSSARATTSDWSAVAARGGSCATR